MSVIIHFPCPETMWQTGKRKSESGQTLYLWEDGNAPATTEYTENNGNYADEPDFRPTLVTFQVPEGTKVKGAVLICARGAFQFRSVRFIRKYTDVYGRIRKVTGFLLAMFLVVGQFFTGGTDALAASKQKELNITDLSLSVG